MMKKTAAKGTLCCSESTLKLDGKEIPTASMERRLLRYMAEYPNIALSRERLLRDVWGYENQCVTRTVDTHVKNLRKHLGEYGSCIVTVRSIGYRFEPKSMAVFPCADWKRIS